MFETTVKHLLAADAVLDVRFFKFEKAEGVIL